MTEFVTTLPESVTREGAKRGRPSIFTEQMQADLTANPGQYAVLQEGVKGYTRVSALRKAHEGFEFNGVVTGHVERENKEGKTVTEPVLTIYVRKPVPAAEVADSSASETTDTPAPAKRTRATTKK